MDYDTWLLSGPGGPHDDSGCECCRTSCEACAPHGACRQDGCKDIADVECEACEHWFCECHIKTDAVGRFCAGCRLKAELEERQWTQTKPYVKCAG